MTGEENLRLIREIEANREFLLNTLAQNPALLARAEPRIRQLLLPPAENEATAGSVASRPPSLNESPPSAVPGWWSMGDG